ncbi:MAG: outer membrane protein assembly factor [Lysobacteraceae bacterium]|nr:MAG: outer membrane protein assembly factor [Xanthomonadaceae bacterium]
MRADPSPRRWILGILLCLLPPLATAAEPGAPAPADEDPVLRFAGVEFEGVDGPLLENLRRRVSLARLKRGTGLRPSRYRYFLRILPAQVDTALQPFGHYASRVEVTPLGGQGELGARVRIEPGPRVRVRVQRLAIEGAGADDAVLGRTLRAFRPGEGDPLDHARYEQSKAEVQRVLGERGYFDAELRQARVEVERARAEASLDLLWDSGPRYRFGSTRWQGSPLREGLLAPLLPWREGDFWRQDRLLRLHQRLAELDLFSRIDIQPRPVVAEDAEGGAVADVDVELLPAARNVYRAGLSYGTDTGPGLRLGYVRRWLNRAGHRLESDFLLGGERSSALLRYRIPAFERFTGWWTVRLAGRHEPFPGGQAEIGEASLLREGRWHDNLVTLGGVVQQEQFAGVGARVVYPQASIERSRSDDPLYPSRGFRWSLLARWGLPTLGSEVRFRQLGATAQWVRSIGAQTRILLRGEVGRIDSGEFQRLPPSLRYFAGGDRSVRGYGYQELAPRDGAGQRAGGRNLLTGSAELERMFSATWGAALFLDAGNAWNEQADLALGVGAGLRWRSPVGPVQVDLARGLDGPEQGLRLHFRLGPPL